MELWDIYDKNRMLTGRTKERGTPREDGEYRLVVHVCIFGSDGRMLIQRRQPFKSGWRGMWDVSAGGSAIAGDDSLTAALREVREELGLALDEEEPRRVLTIQTKGIFDDYYIVRRDVPLTELRLQPEEVAEVRWADASGIGDMIERKIFIPYHKSLIDLLFYMRGHDGARTYSDPSEK